MRAISNELVTIVVVLRDRFSTTEKCLETIIANTPEPYELIVVLGAVPNTLQKNLAARYEKKARFIFEPQFKNPAEYRNIGLRETKTKLAVLMDNDVYVRPGWLSSLVDCQGATQADMVVPLVLEVPDQIHTAGNDLMITHRGGKAYGQKVLRFAKMMYYEDSNLKRQRTDYGELHCQLVTAETARRLGVYDDRLREAGEVDSGLAWSKAGAEMWFEPNSVVFYDFPHKINHVEDIRSYLFKWDMRATLEGYRYFEKKWDLDITECGNWQKFMVFLNDKVGLLSRLYPARVTLSLDLFFKALRKDLLQFSLFRLWRMLKAKVFGFYEWQAAGKDRGDDLL